MDNLRKARLGDLDARAEAIEANLALVRYVSARFKNRGYDADDLFQYGCIGLIKAVDRYDESYGVAFSTYAVPLIIGEIRRFIRDDGAVHISRTIKENAAKVASALDKLNSEGERATIADICAATGLDSQSALLAYNSMGAVMSLSEPVAGEGEILLQDIIGADNNERIMDRLALNEALGKLTEAERDLVYRRYFMRHTQTSIAKEMGLTQVQVSRLETKVLKRLRELIE